MRQIPNAEPEGRLILGPTPSIPGGSPKLRQPTGPRTTHREGVPEPVGQFSTASGLQTFFRRAPTACACPARGRPPGVSTGCSLLPAAAADGVCSHRGARTSFSRCRRFARQRPVADRHPRWGCHSRLAGGHTRSVLRRIVTASSIHSFRRGPPKPPSYSSLEALSFPGETSQSHIRLRSKASLSFHIETWRWT